MKNYKDLEIYQEAFSIAIDVYHLSMKLPHPDKYETGDQIRRSSQSIKDNIVEGYGRRRYKADFVKFLTYSYASLLEAESQSEFLYELHQKKEWERIIQRLNLLGSKLYKFREYVIKKWKS